jgi:hypothetical protein
MRASKPQPFSLIKFPEGGKPSPSLRSCALRYPLQRGSDPRNAPGSQRRLASRRVFEQALSKGNVRVVNGLHRFLVFLSANARHTWRCEYALMGMYHS